MLVILRVGANLTSQILIDTDTNDTDTRMMIHTNADTAKKSIAILIPRVSNSLSTEKGFYCFLVAFMFRLDKIVVVLVIEFVDQKRFCLKYCWVQKNCGSKKLRPNWVSND